MTTLKPSWYTAEGNSTRSEILNLLHPPYTLWHLSYVLIGVSLAPHIYLDRSVSLLVAFFLGLGIGAHALDETMGNPLKSRLSKSQLYTIGLVALVAAISLGVYYALTVSMFLLLFVGIETFFAVAYNLEIFQKRFHNTLVFSLSWGALPFLTGYFVNALGLTPGIVVMSFSIGLLTVVQKTLSSEARRVRRQLKPIDGLKLATGEVIHTTSQDLIRPLEMSLKILSITVFLVAVSLIMQRLF